MRNWQSIAALLMGIVLVIALWPLLKWAVLVIVILVIFVAVRFWYLAYTAKKQLEEAAERMEEESDLFEDIYRQDSYRSDASDDVIDVEYTERRIDDDSRRA